jgi:hypothetical protein
MIHNTFLIAIKVKFGQNCLLIRYFIFLLIEQITENLLFFSIVKTLSEMRIIPYIRKCISLPICNVCWQLCLIENLIATFEIESLDIIKNTSSLINDRKISRNSTSS